MWPPRGGSSSLEKGCVRCAISPPSPTPTPPRPECLFIFLKSFKISMCDRQDRAHTLPTEYQSWLWLRRWEPWYQLHQRRATWREARLEVESCGFNCHRNRSQWFGTAPFRHPAAGAFSTSSLFSEQRKIFAMHAGSQRYREPLFKREILLNRNYIYGYIRILWFNQ